MMVGVPGLWDILGAVGTVFALSHLHLALTSGKAVQLHLRTRVCERREREPLTPWPAVIEASGTQTQSALVSWHLAGDGEQGSLCAERPGHSRGALGSCPLLTSCEGRLRVAEGGGVLPS